ncbi:Uma2 family endonuclease [Actinoplanes sp. NPDC048967]|uniref:Uma2 family endonuclease n=1 Tax=Actinoplanes sp. NPDC048967 TaxID=3155269 RepID=UPI0033FDB32A
MIGDPFEEEPMTAALHLPEKQDWTVDDLVSLPEDLRYELIDGRLILPSPTGVHQIIGVEVVLALRPGCPRGYAPVPDLSLKINNRNEPRPDVVVISLDHIGRSPAPVEGAILAIEIISPDSHFRDMYAKAKVYAAAGVENYWVLDPLFEDGIVLSQFRPGPNGEYEMVGSTRGVFSTDVPFPVTIDLPALTAQSQEMLDHARAEH